MLTLFITRPDTKNPPAHARSRDSVGRVVTCDSAENVVRPMVSTRQCVVVTGVNMAIALTTRV
jgi:hypothetical protein